MNRLKELYRLGQSPWYDNIDRRLIENGVLSSLFGNGVVGVTSNPAIFEKAVGSSSVYDARIKQLKEEGRNLEQIYDEVTCADVRDVADMLKSVYESSAGQDGYVSLEVLPGYARDARKTIDYGRSIFKKVGRPNVMIKVPATKEAPEAITALIAEGINVNVTLIFSVRQYEAAAFAYLEGLRRRSREGLRLSELSSVASVFVSRIDTKIDSLFDLMLPREEDAQRIKKMNVLKGKIAVANAKMIYQRFKEIYADINYADLYLRGGRPQRPLWASTSVKNVNYSDCLYVDNLIGPLTVNTMPHPTVMAFLDHGRPRLSLEEDLGGAREALAELNNLGIDLDKICQEAQTEGLAAFEQSFEAMMNTLKKKTG